MKLMRGVSGVAGIVLFIVGGSLFLVGAVLFGVAFLMTSYARLALLITGGALMFSGVIPLIIGWVLWREVKKERMRLDRLKGSGVRYDATVERLEFNNNVRVGHSLSARAECRYENFEGSSMVVTSGSFLADGRQEYRAVVYVNHRDASDYAVEIFQV